jgi:hypothetical protein
LISYGNPFDRQSFLEELPYYIEKGWGSYRDLIELSMKDFLEIRTALESKYNKEKVENSLGNGFGGNFGSGGIPNF